jgi:hypothetical protein
MNSNKAPRAPEVVVAVCLISFGLSAMAQSPAPSTVPPAPIAEDTSPPSGAIQGEQVFYVRSLGLIADSTFIAGSLNGGGSAMSEHLAFLILQARDHFYQITVAGGNEPKTLRVIKDAFDSAGLVDLHFLDFTFVGSPKGAARVEKLVKAVHGTFHTRLKLDP